MEAELVLIILNCFQRRQLDSGMTREAARVDAPRVVACLAMHDLLRKQPAMPATFAQARAQADDTKRISLARNGPHQRRAINRIGDRAVDHRMNSGLHQGRHPCKGAFQHVRDPVQIIRAQSIHEIGINPVHPPGAAVLFVKSDQQPVLFLTAVIVANRAAQQRHAVAGFGNSGDLFGDEILMLH